MKHKRKHYFEKSQLYPTVRQQFIQVWNENYESLESFYFLICLLANLTHASSRTTLKPPQNLKESLKYTGNSSWLFLVLNIWERV